MTSPEARGRIDFTSGIPNVAWSAAIRISHSCAKNHPPAKQ